MNEQVLRTELLTDPLGRGYSGMTDAQILTSLTTADRTRTRSTLTSAEIYEALDVTEFQAKSDAQKVFVRDILGLGGDVQVGSGTKARTVLVQVFGPGSATIANLVATATVSISRAEELGIADVTIGQIGYCRLP